MTYENGKGTSETYTSQKGSAITIATKFENNLGNVAYCTVEEVFLNKDLHFSVPSDPKEPDVMRYYLASL